MRRLAPVIVLFLLAPIVGELLSGSSPPVEFLRRFSLIVLTVLYGGGAILVREFNLRWGGGWPRLFLLGAAYGIVEEGLMVKSFFDPAWIDLGALGVYGRWAGVNWVWALGLTVFHALFSISVPIALVELLYPQYRGQPWLGRKGLIFFSLLLVADVVFFALGFARYWPAPHLYLLACCLVVVLILLARRLRPAQEKRPTHASPVLFGLLGFLVGTTFFLGFFLVPTLIPSAPLGFISELIWLVVALSLWWSLTRGDTAWSDMQCWAWCTGVLTILIVLAPTQELDKANRPDDTTGMALVGLAMIMFLLWVWRRVRAQVITQ